MSNKSRNAANLVSDNNLFVNNVTDNIGVGTTNPTSKLHVVGDVKITGVTTIGNVIINSSGIITATTFIGNLTGTATTSTKLQNNRTFQINGDIVAPPQNFDGTQNVLLTSSIQPNVVGLGTHTYGDYVKNITGTIGEIEVNIISGEGVTPQIGLPNNVTITNSLSVTDLQVNNNLNVSGNITIGGTAAYIISNDFRVKDADIVTGFTTDSNGNDVSNDTTANHGGISVASTVGTPLVSLVNIGAGETTPGTYKKIMWFKSGSFIGLNTDAWLINYAVGIGSTQFPSGTRLAAGSVQFTERDLAVVQNINASGIVTASSFVGNLSGNATTAGYATTAGISSTSRGLTGTPNIVVGIATASSFVGNLSGNATTAGYATTAGISSTSQGLTGTPNLIVGVVTASSFVGNLSGNATTAGYATTAGISTNVIGGIGSITNLRVSGISTLGIITCGNIFSTGIITASSFVGNLSGNATTATTAGYATTAGIATVAQGLTGTPNIVVGIATASSFVGNLSGNATTATTAGYATTAGIATVAQGLTGIPNLNVGIVTAFNFFGNLSGNAVTATTATTAGYATTAGIATVAQGLTGIPNLNVGIVTAVRFAGDGSTLTGVVAVGSGVEIRSNNNPLGVAATINVSSDLSVSLSSGIATITSPIYWVRQPTGITTTSNVGIGTANPTQSLHVQGNARITGGLYDSNNVVGTAGSVLTSTGTGVSWSTPRSTSILSGSTANIKRANNTYFNFGAVANATESIVTIPLPATGTMSNLYIKLSAAAGAVGTGYTFTVRKNSAATALVVAINGTSNSGSDLINSVSFASGDTFSIEADPTAIQPTDNLDVIWTARFVTS